MLKSTGCPAALCAMMLASSAHAAITFSFASDNEPNLPTFFGSPGDVVNSLFDGESLGEQVGVDLVIDLNGPLPGGAVTIASHFQFQAFSFPLSHTVTPVGGNFLHNWQFGGSFSFLDADTGALVLEVDFTNAAFTAFSGSATALDASSTIQANAGVDGGVVFTAGSVLNGLGVTSADLADGESFAFTLTDITNMANPGAPILIDPIGVWGAPWTAEGSFSAAAVPGPGALALLGAAALLGRRRRS